MPSLITGYEYDIFISYRQKDNKYDGWVTEFVDNLKKELEATFKEEISVYFDINPHDGLLETHDVDASLKEKLKCLVFIPIISRIYCDPKSFAWEHEFKAFVEQTSQDQFGLKVKLPNGNVANRVLPVLIHDLDSEDIRVCESVLGGVLRGIEFIYKSPGVNRPLLPKEENPQENLNHTNYRDQINKLANAVRGIINSIKHPGGNQDLIQSEDYEEQAELQDEEKIINQRKRKIGIAVMTILILLIGSLLVFQIIFKNKKDTGEKLIAVLPFQNLSNDTSQLYFCDGFMEDIINNLQKVNNFTVRPRTSTYQYRDTKKSAPVIGKELNVNYLVGGSIGRERNNLKIRVYLSDSRADKQIWSNDYFGEMKQLFSLQSEIAKEIASELKAVLTPKEILKIDEKPTENSEAYNYYLQGNYYYWKNYNSGENSTAIELYEKAIRLDSGFALAYTGIAECLLSQYFFYKDHSEDVLAKSKKALDKAFEIDPDLPEAHTTLGNYYYLGYREYSKALEQFDIVLKDQPNNAEVIYFSATVHRRAGNWKIAKSLFEKAFELDPGRTELAEDAAETFDLLREYSKAEELYNKSILLQPEWITPYAILSQMYLRWKGDMRKASEVLENAGRNNKASLTDSLIIETKVLIDIYEGNFEEALKDISLYKYDVIQTQFYYKPKTLYKATIYGLMNKPELERAYYDSARIILESKLTYMPDDQRLLGSLGIVYAGLGLDEKAVIIGQKAVKLLPVEKEAYKGPYSVEALALTYIMTGQYNKAMDQINYLLKNPGFLSTRILEIDPRWAPLKNQPGFQKLIEQYTVN